MREREWTLLEKLEGHDGAMDLLSGTYFLGAAIGAGASLIGGLFGASSKKKQEMKNLKRMEANERANAERVRLMNQDVRWRAEAAAKVPIVTSGYERVASSVDIAGMMAAAEKSGFNPVTFLRNGGLAAYARTARDYREEVTGSHAMDAALAGQVIFQNNETFQHTAPTTGEVFGNAISQFGSGVSDYIGQQQQNMFQMSLLNAQLEGNNRAAAQRAYQRERGGGNSPGALRSLVSSVVAPLTGSYKTSDGANSMSTKKPPIDLWVPVIDNSVSGKGRTIWMPNPDIADSEQFAAAIAGSASGTIQSPYNNGPRQPTVDNRIQLQFVNPVTSQPGGGATLGSIGNALSKYFEPWWNNQPIPGGTSW